ncbi:hypothetical protein ACQJBY_065026 [Aegilops geniculata]
MRSLLLAGAEWSRAWRRSALRRVTRGRGVGSYIRVRLSDSVPATYPVRRLGFSSSRLRLRTWAAIDPALKRLMAEIREETARAGESERLKTLHEEAAHSAMGPGDSTRKTIEAEEMRDRTAVEAAGEEDYEADMAAKFRHRWEERWSGYFGSFEDTR